MSRNNLVSGIVVLGIGIGVGLYGLRYDFGTLERLGSGFFPTVLGVIAAMIGIGLMMAGAAGSPEESEDMRLREMRPLGVVLLSVLAFALIIGRFGLLPAVFATVAVSTFAAGRPPMSRVVVLSTSISIASVIVFIYGLNIVVPIVRW